MKFKVVKIFKDKETKEVYEVGQEIDLTSKREKEVEKNLGKGFIEKLPKKD